MRKIGYSSELVNMIDKMIEESEMRRIDLEGMGLIVDRVDRIGDLGDGLSRAASRSRRSRASFTREDNESRFSGLSTIQGGSG